MDRRPTWDEQMTPRAKREPRLDLRHTYWRVRMPYGEKVLSCELYLTEAGLELRAQYNIDDALRRSAAEPRRRPVISPTIGCRRCAKKGGSSSCPLRGNELLG